MATLAVRYQKPSEPYSLLPHSLNAGSLVSEAARRFHVSREAIDDIYPATPLQEAVISLEMIKPGAYFAQMVYEAPVDLDPQKLSRAWKVVARQHTILRSRFMHSENLDTVQAVVDVDLPFFHDENNEVSLHLANDRLDRIELGDPMARLALVGRRNLVLTAHHAVYDGFSLPMLAKDLGHAYNKGSATVRIPFSQFVHHLLRTDRMASSAFWHKYLDNVAPTEFPSFWPQSYKVQADSSKVLKIDIGETHNLGVTVATVANAAWALLLCSYADADDVSFGTTLAGRDVDVQDIASLPGPTLATIPVRHTIQRGESAISFLHKVQSGALDVIKYQHHGLQHIAQLHAGAKTASDFRTVFVVFPSEKEDESWLKLNPKLSTGDLDNFAMYPVAVLFRQMPKGAEITLNYDSKLLPKPQAHRVMHHFEHILRSILAAGRSTLVGDILTISPQDLAEIHNWNAEIAPSEKMFIHEQFSMRASETPTHPAVCAFDGDFDFAMLDRLSSRLAGALQAQGAGDDTLIGICCKKSKWTIVAMLAVLKANAAFVPLNHEDALQRRRELVGQSGIQILITLPGMERYCRELAPVVLSLGDKFLDGLSDNAGVLRRTVKPSSPAWVIFTSGSTGKPKGVVISHSAFSTSIRTLTKELGMDDKTRCLQFAAHVWDLSILEMMGPLSVGGCVCIPSEEQRMNDLPDAVVMLKANTAVFTPTLLRSLQVDDFSRLEKVVLAGEAVSSELIERWAGNVKLFSVWAPAETTIGNTVVRLRRSEQSGELGRVVNARCWLTQSHNPNVLAPIGAPGELLVEGPVLAKGYLNNVERTEAAFVTGLKWATPGTRFYRTGDLAHYDADGTLRFIGRRDAQVKIRGQRIELGEIEHHLSACAGVCNSGAFVPKEGRLAGQLVAVMTFSQCSSLVLNMSELSLLKGQQVAEHLRRVKDALQQVLPKFGVPSVWLPLQFLPHTTSGKLDRVRLLQWLSGIDAEVVGANASSALVPPATPFEQQLQQIWSKVLNIDTELIGRETSFFQFGDSISAMQVVSACRAVGIGLTVQALLKSKTIARVSELNVSVASLSTQRRQEDEGTVFALSPIQKVYASLRAISRRWNQSILLRARAPVEVVELERALGPLIARNPMLRMRLVQQENGDWHQIVAPSEKDAFKVFATTSSSRATTEAALEQAQQMIDIQRGPIMTAVIIKTPGEQLLFLTAHHMAIDLISWRVLLQDVEVLLRGEPLVSDVPLTFQTWLQLQKQYVEAKQPRFPRALLANLDGDWSLARQQNTIEDALHLDMVLDHLTTEQIFGKCNRAFRTEPVDLLLAGLWIALRMTFDSQAVPTIFNEAHGRETWDSSIDVSRTVGWFTTLQPLDLEKSSEVISAAEVVRCMKEARRSLSNCDWSAAFAHHCMDSDSENVFLGAQLPVDVVFNFGGSFQQFEAKDSLFDLVPESEFRREDHGASLGRLGLFEIEAMVFDGELRVSMSYNEHIQDGGRVLENLKRSLSEIAVDLWQLEAGLTASDFPLLQASNSQMLELTGDLLPNAGVVDLANVDDIYPCQPLVDLFALSQEYDPMCHVTFWTVRLSVNPDKPSLDVGRLEAAWRRVVERHTALRTVFVLLPTKHSRYQQVVLQRCDINFVQLLASSGTNAIRVLEERPSIIPASKKPQHCLVLATDSTTGDVYVKMEINHTFSDGASMGLLWKDLFDQYHGQVGRQAPPYVDFMDWTSKQPWAENDKYWAEYMRDTTPSVIPTGDTGLEDAFLIADASEGIDVDQLHRMCREQDVSVSAVILTAWIFLVAVLSKVEYPNCVFSGSGRDIDVDGIDNMVGVVTSVMLQRIQLRKAESFTELVSRVQGDFHAHLERQFFHFDRMQPPMHELNNSSASIQPMKSILPDEEESGGIRVEHIHAIEHPAIDFLFSGSYGPKVVSLLVKYHRARTTEGFVKRMIAVLKHVIDMIIEQPAGMYWPLFEELRDEVLIEAF